MAFSHTRQGDKKVPRGETQSLRVFSGPRDESPHFPLVLLGGRWRGLHTCRPSLLPPSLHLTTGEQECQRQTQVPGAEPPVREKEVPIGEHVVPSADKPGPRAALRGLSTPPQDPSPQEVHAQTTTPPPADGSDGLASQRGLGRGMWEPNPMATFKHLETKII